LFFGMGLGHGQRCENCNGQESASEGQLHVLTPDLVILVGAQTFAEANYGNGIEICQMLAGRR
ncbi:MAG TPA: hypothetical protein VJS90_20220, partial [Pseudomonas sp.]|uniref:hypothetical protein n=1 Tax=Pseudomonas sp. TaxID=306 RepID=UPI002B4785BC